MPTKNVRKNYLENGYYHLYNRGVEKRIIFQDDQDYKVFLSYLKLYLEPPNPPKERLVNINNTIFATIERPLKNFNNEISLLAYCLMPNHFHLLVKQKSLKGIASFTQSLLTKYSTYFNKRYERVGPLFQGVYKAVSIDEENYLLHLSRYIHLNPTHDAKVRPLRSTYSSYGDYLGERKTGWLNTELILSFFKNSRKVGYVNALSYQSFVEDSQNDPQETLGSLTLE